MSEWVIDRPTFDALAEAMGADFIGELVDTYCGETPDLIDQLGRALAAGDADACRRLAHSIKSSSTSMGALHFAAQARELEMMGKAGDLSAAPAALSRLVADYRRVERALSALAQG